MLASVAVAFSSNGVDLGIVVLAGNVPITGAVLLLAVVVEQGELAMVALASAML